MLRATDAVVERTMKLSSSNHDTVERRSCGPPNVVDKHCRYVCSPLDADEFAEHTVSDSRVRCELECPVVDVKEGRLQLGLVYCAVVGQVTCSLSVFIQFSTP